MSANAESMRYREATPADSATLFAWGAGEVGERPDAAATRRSDYEAWLARALASKDRLLLVAVRDEVPVVHVRYDRVEGDVLAVNVAATPDAWSAGWATRALRETAGEARSRLGARRICAHLRPADGVSRRAFAEADYVEEKTTTGGGLDRIRCWWPDVPAADWRSRVAAFKRVAWTGTDTVAEYVARTSDHAGVSKAKNLLERRFVERHARGRALDAGCGAGRFTAPLARRTPFVVGLDYSRAMLLQTRALLESRGATQRLVRGDAARLPFPDACFDSVVSITVLEHFPHYEAMLAEYVRVLAPGGTLVFEMPNARHPDPRASEGDPNPFFYVSRLDPRRSEALLHRFGLELIRCTPYDFWNQNEVVMRGLGLGRRGRRRLNRWINRVLAFPGVARSWTRIEDALLRHLPDPLAPNILMAARKAS